MRWVSGREEVMARRKKTELHYTKAKVTDDDATIYKILREEFTAADLQKYTEMETLIPIDKVLRQLDRMERKTDKNRKA
jgi:hypothetical protein